MDIVHRQSGFDLVSLRNAGIIFELALICCISVVNRSVYEQVHFVTDWVLANGASTVNLRGDAYLLRIKYVYNWPREVPAPFLPTTQLEGCKKGNAHAFFSMKPEPLLLLHK